MRNVVYEAFLYWAKWGMYLTDVPQYVEYCDVEDYPRTLIEIEARFPTEESCRDYLFLLRWPDGFRCPRAAKKKLGR
jgi:hypothetical protein